MFAIANPSPGDIRLSKGQVMQVLTGSHQPLPLEKEALTKAISAEFLKQEGWSEGSHGVDVSELLKTTPAD
jgi:hypothetical protein